MGMARYDYRCTECNTIVEREFRESTFVGRCSTCEMEGIDPIRLFKRVFHCPSINRVWHPHWNMTTGQVVSDRKQMIEQMHRASEEVSERLGGPHNFIPVDPSDIQKTDEGLDVTHDRHVALGWK